MLVLFLFTRKFCAEHLEAIEQNEGRKFYFVISLAAASLPACTAHSLPASVPQGLYKGGTDTVFDVHSGVWKGVERDVSVCPHRVCLSSRVALCLAHNHSYRFHFTYFVPQNTLVTECS